MEFLGEFLGELGFFVGQVVVLAEVVAEVVELDVSGFKDFDEFVVAHADGTGGSHGVDVVVVWVVEVERLAIEGCFLSCEQRGEADTIEVLYGSEWQPCEVEDGGVEIGAAGGFADF